MPRPSRGEVWIIDLGMAAKVRPCLLLTDWPADNELALITVLAHTTTLRGSSWEHQVPKPFLREGAFHLQQIQSVPAVKLERKLGELTVAELAVIDQLLKKRLKV
ncbi:MAG: type II toxin-antitoxin system PemK/MazF family toxin [Pedosphaera sp.]|nr:type II toxin-antitoxin system PemK/MazF family toxin [Pedosphaera sp.]